MIKLKATSKMPSASVSSATNQSSSSLLDKTTTTTTKSSKLNNSSELLSRLEPINWLCSINTIVNGRPTTILIKYLYDEQQKSYAILLSDFAQTYFECSTSEQIEKNYQKYNKIRLQSNDSIHSSLKLLMENMPDTIKNIEKISVDCHTTRITLRCTKQITTTFCLKWTFHIISTEEDIFLKHFSLPMFRGLMYYYNLSHQQQQSQQQAENQDEDVVMIQEPSSVNNGHDEIVQPMTGTDEAKMLKTESTTIQNAFNFVINDNILNEIFRLN